MDKMIKIKRKGDLEELWRVESWDCIAFWGDGTWARVGTGYGGEQDGDDPVYIMTRMKFYNTTVRERKEKMKEIEYIIN